MKNLFNLLLCSSIIVSCNNASKQSDYIASTEPILENACPTLDSIRFCQDKSNTICPELPLDVYFLGSTDGNFNNGYSSVLAAEIQPSFDNFSWQSFAALNWASDAKGKPIGSSIAQYPELSRVWEHYTKASKVFNAGNKEVNSFEMSNSSLKVMSQTSKISNDLHLSGFKEADDFPLIDRNLNFVVYEVKINPIEEKFINDSLLYTKKGIYDYYKANGAIKLPVQNESLNLPGAIEIKASWRILDAKYGDDLSKYYTQKATIVVSSENSVSGQSFSFDCTIGLVGMHILRKTAGFKNWVWSTFEHIDNVPDNVQEAQTAQQNNWSFYNSECLNCPVNQPPNHIFPRDINKAKDTVYKWNITAPYAAPYAIKIPGEANGKVFGTQVTRVYPIYYCTEQVNSIWQSKLSALGSVFANYKLIGTQWMIPTDGEPPAIKINAPFRLANTTAETYMQEDASCISCHTFAGITYITKANDTINIATDFSFAFGYAQ